MDTIKTYYQKFKSSSIYIKLISIHVLIYLVCEFGNLFFGRFLTKNIQQYFGLYSSFSFLASHPWTLISNAFFHRDGIHLLLNSLFLFSIAKLFLSFFEEKTFLKFYFLGILGSSLGYLIGTHFLIENNFFIPRFLYGSSGAVVCVFFSLIAYRPNMPVLMPFLGSLEIKYLGPILLLLSFSEAGGNLAHLGGALIGFFYMKNFKKGKDIFNEISKIDLLKFFNKNQKKRIKKILNKISTSGYESLSEKEKKILFEKSKD